MTDPHSSNLFCIPIEKIWYFNYKENNKFLLNKKCSHNLVSRKNMKNKGSDEDCFSDC